MLLRKKMKEFPNGKKNSPGDRAQWGFPNPASFGIGISKRASYPLTPIFINFDYFKPVSNFFSNFSKLSFILVRKF